MRGLDVTLVEQGNLTHGTTGRMHGLLHSGGRYAVSDQASATSVSRKIEFCEISLATVSHDGGRSSSDLRTPRSTSRRSSTASGIGIPAEVVSGEDARAMEPHLAKDIDKAISVPDGAIDPFRLVVANAASAQEHGARIETHTTVTDLLVESGEVVGIEVEHDSGPGKRGQALNAGRADPADYVVNATGAWAGQIGDMAGVDVAVRPSKGVMTIMNVRQVDTVVNRCRPKGDADIVVPHETTCILGTTDEEVDDPEDYPEEGWEVDLMIDTLSELIPMLDEARTIRSFWGVRPLYAPPDVGSDDPTDPLAGLLPARSRRARRPARHDRTSAGNSPPTE